MKCPDLGGGHKRNHRNALSGLSLLKEVFDFLIMSLIELICKTAMQSMYIKSSTVICERIQCNNACE